MATGPAEDVGAAVYDVGDVLGLMSGAAGNRTFTSDLIAAFVANPLALVSRLPAIASAGLAALVHALDPTGALVTTATIAGGSRRFAFGADALVRG